VLDSSGPQEVQWTVLVNATIIFFMSVVPYILVIYMFNSGPTRCTVLCILYFFRR
jgi:hypothetical protein